MGADSTYSRYLRSPHWRRLRQQFKRERGWTCKCGETQRLELHHLTYERLGHERLDDLQPLCPDCHALVHQLVREGQLDLALTDFFSNKRARPQSPRPAKKPYPKRPKPRKQNRYPKVGTHAADMAAMKARNAAKDTAKRAS